MGPLLRILLRNTEQWPSLFPENIKWVVVDDFVGVRSQEKWSIISFLPLKLFSSFNPMKFVFLAFQSGLTGLEGRQQPFF